MRTLFSMLSLLSLALTSSLQANTVSPGANLLYADRDPNLAELLYLSHSPVISPDGKHLYLNRQAEEGEPAVLVFGLADDEFNRPFFIRSYTLGTDSDSLSSDRLLLHSFNPSGSRVYAIPTRLSSNGTLVSSGLTVLARDPATGDLDELQSITEPAGQIRGGPVVSADGRHLYVSTSSNNTVSARNIEVRRYTLSADDGPLQNPVSINVPNADDLRFLKLIDNDTRLLGSTETALVEYQRDTNSGDLTLVQSTPLPALPQLPASIDDADGELPGPVSSAVTSDGRFVYSIKAQSLNRHGGFLNVFERSPATGALTLTSQVLPSDFKDHVLFETSQILLSDAEDRLFVPSSHHRFFAGSPARFTAVSTFVPTAERGTVQLAGTQFSDATGRGWAAHPLTDRFYSSGFDLKPFTNFPASGTAIGIWQPGRIVQPSTIHSAVLPISRTVGNHTANSEAATYFTSVLNPGPHDAEECTITHSTSIEDARIELGFQVNDLVTNEPLNEFQFDSEFDVPAGGVTQLTISVSALEAFDTQNVQLRYRCLNSPDATRIQGVNTLLISASTSPLPDMITGVATAESNGIARLPGLSGTGFFAASTINIGAEAELRAVPVFDLADLITQLEPGDGVSNATLRICETNPENGECLSPPAAEISRRFPNQDIATYTVFVVGNGSDIPLDPARNRVFIAFVDEAGEVRGASSVAVTTNAEQ